MYILVYIHWYTLCIVTIFRHLYTHVTVSIETFSLMFMYVKSHGDREMSTGMRMRGMESERKTMEETERGEKVKRGRVEKYTARGRKQIDFMNVFLCFLKICREKMNLLLIEVRARLTKYFTFITGNELKRDSNYLD